MTSLRACIEGNSRIAFGPLDPYINQLSLSTDSVESSPSRDKQNADIPVRVTSKSSSDLIHQFDLLPRSDMLAFSVKRINNRSSKRGSVLALKCFGFVQIDPS
jgi:hypothetical protein